MDDSFNRMLEQLQKNPDVFQNLLRSPGGARLRELAEQSQTLQQAATQASNGSTASAARLVQQYLSTPEGAQLKEQLRKVMGK